MKFEDLIDTIKSLHKYNRLAIITHQDADPDAIGSAIGMSYLLKQLYPTSDVNIIVPGGASKLARRVFSRIYGSDLELSKEFIQADIYVLVDVNNLSQLGDIGKNLENIRNRIIVIDHHIPTKGTLSRVRCKWIFTEAKACSLMVFTLLENLGMDIPSDLATLLLAGILYDTRRFLHANSRVFEVCSKLLKRGANYALALSSLVTTEVDISEKIAILKGLRRMDILRIGEFIVALSYVSAYEGVLARTLISLGVDLAIVVAEKNDTIRISARSSSKFYKLTGISLGKDLLPAIGRVIHGEGGGHATAGGAVGRGSLGQVLSRVYDIVIDILWKRLA